MSKLLVIAVTLAAAAVEIEVVLTRSLYVHFPFCESKCHYCDFYSLGRENTKSEDYGRFEESLNRESARVAPLLAAQLDTVFFGGGTPSMTSPEAMARALEPLNLAGRVTAKTEWTMEANPSSINSRTLAGYRTLGVNRISMGVQALRPELLVRLGRVHSREDALTALDTVFKTGFDNVSVDLLCGVPGQTHKDIEDAIALLTDFPVTHLSCYLLTLPRHHKMYSELPNEETQLEHLLLIDRLMHESGFEHYEISNFARTGKQARHNLAYWTGAPYLGLGPSAHSFDSTLSKRWKNVTSLRKYADLLESNRSPVESAESLTDDQRALERWMLALRLSEGFPASWLSTEKRRSRAQQLELQGLMEKHPTRPGHCRLTARGFALSDQVIASLV